MQTIISLIIFILLLYWVCKIYLSNKTGFRIAQYEKGEYYLLPRNMYFVIFTVCTAPIFLGSLSLLKYGLWFATILLLIFAGKLQIKIERITTMYIIFFLWLCYTMTYTTVPWDGVMMLIKYSLPILFLWLGYSAISNEKDLIVFLKVVNIVACIYCFLIGGQGWKLMPWLYNGPIGNQFSVYAAFADYLTSIFIVPIMLYWLTHKKRYIFCALWLILSTLLQSVRTGLGGMLLVFIVALLLKNKAKAIPGIFLAGVLFLGVILFVPNVNEKFFGENTGRVSAMDIMQGNALSMENIEMSGREYIWKAIKENCYYGNEIRGIGLGETEFFSKHLLYDTGEMAKAHNDYLILICDAGLIGILLLSLFYYVVIHKVASNVIIKRSSSLVRITGIMALSSMVGIGFCMYFDNVVSNSMQSMVMPYIYLGFFLKALDIDKDKHKTLTK